LENCWRIVSFSAWMCDTISRCSS